MCCVEGTCVFFFQAEDGIRDLVRSRGLGDVYKRQVPVTQWILSGVVSAATSSTQAAKALCVVLIGSSSLSCVQRDAFGCGGRGPGNAWDGRNAARETCQTSRSTPRYPGGPRARNRAEVPAGCVPSQALGMPSAQVSGRHARGGGGVSFGAGWRGWWRGRSRGWLPCWLPCWRRIRFPPSAGMPLVLLLVAPPLRGSAR